jgi:DNA-binding NarL/FixJ family response regulator
MHQTLNLPEHLSASATAGAPINVWLVDDNKNIRSAVTDLLGTCAGVRCTGSYSSPNAVLSALASKTGPDVILLDIQMGDANGLDAIRPIKTLSRSTQVLMFTTCFDSESKKRAFTNGASDFLLKTTPIERILDSIQRASKNPAPHLKRSRSKNSPPASTLKAGADCHSRQRFSWIEKCLNRMLHRVSVAAK